MPQLINLKFAPEEMPRLYDPNGVEGLAPEDFVFAERDKGRDVGFVAGIEWLSSEQLKLRLQAAPRPRILRRATDAEKDAFFTRKAMERRALVLCKEVAVQLKLPIKISAARIDPNDGRVVFHFTSDQRIDFRALVSEMSARLKSRIELWQVGVRDEAKKVDGFGVCGLRTCCSAWLPEFRPISLRHARDQEINLPPGKLSGLCGRLLCCLSYEVDQYREMGRKLLPKGATVEVQGRKGVIIDRNILLGKYTLKMEDGPYQVVVADEMGNVRIPDQMKRMADAVRGGIESGGADLAVEEPRPAAHAPPQPKEQPADRPKPDQENRRKRTRSRGGRKQSGGESARPSESPKPKPEAAANKPADAAAGDGDGKPRRRRGKRGGRRNRGGSGGGGEG